MKLFLIRTVIILLSCVFGYISHDFLIGSEKHGASVAEKSDVPAEEKPDQTVLNTEVAKSTDEANSTDTEVFAVKAENEVIANTSQEPTKTFKEVAKVQATGENSKDARSFAEVGEPFFKEYCYSCHGKGEKLKGDIDLTQFATDESIVKDRDTWELILELVETEEMPTKKPLPMDEERAEFVHWLHAKLDEVDWSKVQYAGYVPMPLLNKKEYGNTLRDLLGVDFGVGEILFADGEGESGFTTDRSNLFLSPAAIEKYLESAEKAINLLEEQTTVTKNELKSRTKRLAGKLDQTFEAEDMLTTDRENKGVNVKGSKAVRLPVGQTTIYDSFNVPIDGDYIFELRGTSYNNDNASIRVTINDKLEANLPFPGKGYTTQSFKMFLSAGDHRMAFNKGTDQNKRTEKNGVKTYHKESNLDKVRIKFANTSSKITKETKQTYDGTPLYSFKPPVGLTESQAVKKTLTHFLLRSFRRPVEDEVLEKYLNLYNTLRKQGAEYSFALKQTMVSILVSPRFLYRNELVQEDIGDAQEYELDHFQIASRLSYFLWLSMPDKELFVLATKKQLRDPEVLRQQVKRMLADPKSRDFSAAFLGQWLGFEALGHDVNPDADTFPEFDDELAKAMKEETVLTFEHLIAKDYNLLTLVDSKATYLNERLAKHYGIDGVRGSEMRPVALKDKNRGGLLGMGSILTATSSPTRTSPVLRGIWVLERMLGDRIPEAPADVPEIDPKIDQQKSTTLRKELEVHRENPSCARCHDKIDPIGFGLENFDALGRFRTKEASGNPIDSSGEMEGHKFTGAAELKQWILENRKEEFIRTVSEKMLAFAIGRKIEPFDEAAVLKIIKSLEENDYKASVLMQEIVLSHPFLNRSLNNEVQINE